MKRERPILFSAPMVRAILSGAKTQTRRLVTAPGWEVSAYDQVRMLRASDDPRIGLQALFGPTDLGEWVGVKCPYGVPGDRLWVRETWAPMIDAHTLRVSGLQPDDTIRYRANGEEPGRGFSWRPSIHMPRWASRITLEITDVRVQRLQDISEDDAKAEGVTTMTGDDCWSDGTHRTAFEYLWGEINGWPGQPRAQATWDSNPWVWAISFKRVEEKSNAA